MTREEHITQAAEPAEEPGTEEVAPEAASSPVPESERELEGLAATEARDRARGSEPMPDDEAPAAPAEDAPAQPAAPAGPAPAQPAAPPGDAPAQPAAPAGPEADEPAEASAPPKVVAPPEPDYKDQWLRAVAELDNVRKRARRDVAAAEGRGAARLARELLPALDNFDRALAAAEDQPENRDHHLTEGIRLVQKELLAALTRVGIEPESPKGERFDPHRHEAVAQHAVEGTEPGTIVEVYQAGYRIGDDVLRPAKVVVAG